MTLTRLTDLAPATRGADDPPVRGAVLAAVDGSALAVPVVHRAAGHARANRLELVVVTVIPVPVAAEGPFASLQHDLDGYDDALAVIDRVHEAVSKMGMAYRIEVRGYLARGGPRRHARRIANAVLRVAEDARAQTIVVGAPSRGRSRAGTSVARLVSQAAPADVAVSFAPRPEPWAVEEALAPTAGGRIDRRRPPAPLEGTGQVVLTREGRDLLADRARRLDREVIAALLAAMRDGEHDGRWAADFDRASGELDRIRALIVRAVLAEDLPDDPELVELGELVTVRTDDGIEERYLIVDPVEAPLDDRRISSRSPLATAVLGRRVGEQVDVEAPAGRYRCTILAAQRGAPTTNSVETPNGGISSDAPRALHQ